MRPRAAFPLIALLLVTQASAAWGQPPKRPAVLEPLPLLPAEQAWIVTLGAPTAAGGAMDDRHVYVPIQGERIVALDRETGATVWMREIETAWAPVAGGGVVYLAASDELHALDAVSGLTRWRVPLDAPLGAPLSLDAGWLMTVSDRGDVTAYRAADGERLWQQQMGAAPWSGAVFGEGDVLYITVADGRTGALDLADGHVRWETRLPGRLSAPAWARDRVLVGSDDNYIYALDARRGALVWRWRTGGDVLGAAAWDDLVIIASLDNTVRAVNRGNGNQQWYAGTRTRPLLTPLAFPRLAIIPGTNPTLSGYALTDGSAVGTYTAPGDLQGPPLIDPDLRPYRVAAAIVMRDGRVAGLHPVAMLFRDQPVTPLPGLLGRALPRDAPAPVSVRPR